jgi:cell division septal protein FtsQ
MREEEEVGSREPKHPGARHSAVACFSVRVVVVVAVFFVLFFFFVLLRLRLSQRSVRNAINCLELLQLSTWRRPIGPRGL